MAYGNRMSIRCAWCRVGMTIDVPDLTVHCVLVRRCTNCTGSNTIEITGARAQVTKHRHGREDTGKVRLPKF
jgi:hypothetical protein